MSEWNSDLDDVTRKIDLTNEKLDKIIELLSRPIETEMTRALRRTHEFMNLTIPPL